MPVMVAAMLGVVGGLSRPAAAAAGPLSITVSSSPAPAALYQAVEFRVKVTNTGGAAATGVTLTNTMAGIGATAPYPIQLPNGPVTTSNLCNCTFANPTETCTAASIAAGQVWNVTIIVGVAAPAGTAYSDAAKVSGTESSATVGATAAITANASQPLPAGFTQTKLAGGLSKPIALAFAPNGDMYIAEQGGKILIDRAGTILPTPVITLNVLMHGETGVLGLALDSNFATNGYMYVSYTAPVTTGSRNGRWVRAAVAASPS